MQLLLCSLVGRESTYTRKSRAVSPLSLPLSYPYHAHFYGPAEIGKNYDQLKKTKTRTAYQPTHDHGVLGSSSRKAPIVTQYVVHKSATTLWDANDLCPPKGQRLPCNVITDTSIYQFC
jgi:hypothetical protein